MNRACLNVILLSVVTAPVNRSQPPPPSSSLSSSSCSKAMALKVCQHMAIHTYPVCRSTDSRPFQRLKCKTFQIGNCNKMINILFLHVTCFYLPILLFHKVEIVATQLEHSLFARCVCPFYLHVSVCERVYSFGGR